MTDNEIIKALECCTKLGCSDNETKECPLKPYEDCSRRLAINSLILINRQKAEIENYKHLDTILHTAIDILAANIKSEAIREFAENLKSLVNRKNYLLADIYNSKDFGMFTIGFEQAIDEIVTQMTGDKNA